MNCSGGRMPWGSWITCEETVNGYDVGDDFTRAGTPRHRPRPTSRTPGSRRTTASSSRCRRRARHGQPITHAGRFPHESVAWDPQRRRALPQRGQLRVPVRLLQVRPAGRTRSRPAGCSTAAGSTCSRSWASTNADLAAHIANGTTFDVEWVEIDQPSFDFGRPAPGGADARPTTRRMQFVSTRVWPRVPPSSPGSRARSTTAAGSTSLDPGRRRDRRRPSRTRSAASARASVRSGPTTPRDADAAHAVRVAEPGRARLPGQRDHQHPRHAHRVRGRRELQLPARADPQGRALRHRPEQDRHPAQRRVRRLDVQPGRRTLFVNIQSTVGMSIAIWGPWGRIGV